MPAETNHLITDLLTRIVIPSRLALICRAGETLGYNPGLNVWHRLDQPCAETLRWLRAGRDRSALTHYLARRFDYSPADAAHHLERIVHWCILRRLLYLDRQVIPPELTQPENPLQTVYWICTQACNLNCTYCYQDARTARPRELSTAEAKDLIVQAAQAGAREFVFTGGEPFVRRDLLELALFARSQKLRTSVITNGHYVTRNNVHAVAAAFHQFTISLDHMTPEHHDRLRGRGSWRHAIDAIDLLLEAGARVDVNSTLSADGLHDLRELVGLKYKKRIGAHRIVPQFPLGRGASSRQDELTPTALLRVNDDLHQAHKEWRDRLRGDPQPPAPRKAKGERREHCGAGLTEVSVDPEGWVYPCRLLQRPDLRAGNIRESRISEIVATHTAIRRVRRSVAGTLHPCKTCIIKAQCGGGCRGIHVSFTGDYVQSNPLFCAHLRQAFEVRAWSSTGQVPPPRDLHFDQAETCGPLIPVSALTERVHGHAH